MGLDESFVIAKITINHLSICFYQAKKAVLKGMRGIKKRKVHKQVTFRRPKTLKLPRKPRYPRKSVPRRPR